MTQILGIAKQIATEPTALILAVLQAPAFLMAFLLYRMHTRNDQNFREVIRVIKDVGRVINENTGELAAFRANREHDDHRHRRG